MAVKKSKYKTGWRLLLIKAIGAIVIVFVIEAILDALNNKDPLGSALTPFHNHYFSFSSYYLTDPGMSSDFSDSPLATTRFAIYFLLGYLAYAVINILIWLVPALKRQAARINSVLFNLLVLGSFLLALFFPRKITVIDTDKKEIRITTHSYFFIPATTYIPFNTISTIKYNPARDYDGYNKQYVNYLIITLSTKTGAQIPMGAIQAGEQKGTLIHKPIIAIPPEKSAIAQKVVLLMDKLVVHGS